LERVLAGEVAADQRRNPGGSPHGHHDALQIEAVAHVRRAGRHLTRSVERRVDGLVHRVERPEPAFLLELRRDPVHERAQTHGHISLSITVSTSRSTGPYSYFDGQTYVQS